ncbi:MAG: class I adenylate-forming enzyme family protein [Jatrophihabitantaceae bacterium]
MSDTSVLAQTLERALIQHGPTIAVSDGREQLSYLQLLERARQVSRRLQSAELGLPAGRRPQVLICAANSAAYVAGLLGVLLAGAVPFLLDPALAQSERDSLLSSCGIDLILSDSDISAGRGAGAAAGGAELAVTSLRAGTGGRPSVLADTAQPGTVLADTAQPGTVLADTVLADTEVCRFTSGSTRTPACIEFSGAAVLNAARAWLAGSGLAAGDRVLCFAGLYNGLAFNTSLIPGLLSGATLWLPRAQPSAGYVARYLEQAEPHVLVGFPALYAGLSRRPGVLAGAGQLRTALSSAARLDPAIAADMQDRHGIAVGDYYGIAETGPLTINDRPWLKGQQGRPLDGVAIRLADPAAEGPAELLVRSTSMGSRYLNYPELLAQRLTPDGYYRTGDRGRLAAGRLELAGRSTAYINVGGKKVSPEQVRQALLTHPGVEEAHVLGLSLSSGENIVAALVQSPAALTEDGLRSHCVTRLASHMRPSLIRIVPQLPRSGSGKVAAAEVARLLGRELAGSKAETAEAGPIEAGPVGAEPIGAGPIGAGPIKENGRSD